ncbi:ComEC/Rec2 family competence protein [Rubritalea tangerina]|uniref:ComEC/Rec2 family competence protein n=1 Tax=Rubritalea tangerina TaxID=430798 RepID=A0ABW4ZBA7_9BACT
MDGPSWLRKWLARCPLAISALTSVLGIIYAEGGAVWCLVLFILACGVAGMGRRWSGLVAVVCGVLSWWGHSSQLERQEVARGYVGDWGEMEVVVMEAPQHGRMFVRVCNGELAGQKFQAWFPHGVEEFRIGERVQIEGRIVEPRVAMNPDVFDEVGWLHRSGVGAIILVSDVDRSGDWDYWYAVKRWAWELREECGRRLVRGLEDDGDAGKVIKAMALGVRPSQSEALLRDFRYSGAIHVFAVSGLHVMMVGSMVALVLRGLGVPKRVWIPLVIGSLFFYALVTGMRPPALRAAIMGGILLSTWLFQRSIVLVNSVAAGAVVVLLLDGHMLYHPGFQLSFGVLLAISILGGTVTKGFHWVSYVDPFIPRSLYSRWQELSFRVRRKVQGALVVASCAWVGASPLTFVHFKLLAPISILVSLPLVLLLYCILALAGTSLLVGSFWTGGSAWVNQWNGRLAESSYAIASRAAKVPMGHLLSEPWADGERIVIYSLRDGDAAYYLGLGGGTLLDCGGVSSFDREVRPSLSREGAVVDSVILSHADAGHCGGLESLLAMRGIKQAVVPEVESFSRRYMAGIDALENKGVRVLRAELGQKLECSSEAWCEVLYVPQAKGGVADDRGLVLRLHWRGLRVLFLGDAGFLYEQWSLKEGADVAADLVVVGGHQRDLGVSDTFIASTGARVCVVEERREGLEVDQYVLPEQGALTVEWEREGFRWKSQRGGILHWTLGGER